ncbi:protein Wiz-like isoform X2 [Chelmon rostratus]|uniref:protein Wiz-like isoform X2 n=1 Tax=Chelmon rostratus TaxID=109905 RepID=UPI001BECE815|nr:protein Wiz-like isoform X2 [Chelmon rostratus]
MDSQAPQPVICEVCGTYFETRRGLSSHARLHLRQLGVTLSESSGAPIDLLYQLIQERDGSLPNFKADSAGLTPLKTTSQQESGTRSDPEDTSASYKAGSRVVTTPQKMDHQGSPARLKESATSLLPSPPSGLRLVESGASEGNSSSSLEHQTTAKPQWAPLETDAPITLDTSDEVHVCQLCGCWYETRKGLSSHARAHLRHIGIPDSEIKGSPIDLLYQIMEEEDLKPITSGQQEELTSNSPPRSSSKHPSGLSSPPASPPSKRPKTSEDCTCILCGEEFENRKGLSSHARSHLRQLGVSDLLGKSSAIDTIQELVSSGMLEAMHPPKTSTPTSSPAAPSAAARALSPAPGQSRTSFPSISLSPSPEKLNPQPPVNRAPKAKKGFRLAVDPLHRKPKPEPVEIEVAVQPKGSSANSTSPVQKSPAATVGSKPLNADVQSPPTVLCDFCGQLFDTRKALSCHARAHLRQLGLTWSIKTSPIDLLKEVMMHSAEGRKEPVPSGSSGKATWTPSGSRRSLDSLQSGEPATKSCTSPLDYSMKEKSPSGKSGAHADTSCELCGFDFENRKALASHARAHLRQLGIIEWKADGATSPIELLSKLIRRDPVKVAAITRRYRMGDLYIKKSQRTAASPSLSTDSDSLTSLKLSGHHPEHKVRRDDSGVTAGSSRQSQGHSRSAAAHGDPGVRSPRGAHPPKHVVPAREENSQQPSRSGSIPALLPKPPLTPLVKLVGKVYSLKCRFCEEVFHGPLSVQEQWIAHLQKHILSLGYKGKASPPAAPVAAPALVHPVAV